MQNRAAGEDRPRLISTKLKPPADSGNLLARPRLISKLAEGRNRRLTLIHGPAGFGKTTLAVQWRQALIESGVRVAWLSLDKEDDELERCLFYIVEAIRCVEPSIAVDAMSLLEAKSDQAAWFVLTDLVNELEACAGEFFLVLDDWHLIRNEAIQDALSFLIERAPANLHLVINSRTQPPLALAKLRVQNQLTEIEGGDLRFDMGESSTFLRELNHLSIGSDEANSLWRSTEGWIAALQLALLSLRATSDRESLIRWFSGKHHAIGEYLAENVLNSLPPSTLDFLLKTSILERLCGDLCAAVTGRADGQATLERLEKEDLFIRPLDEEMQWFRYHHLFADFLRRRLERDYPETVASLHRSACEWFAGQGQTGEAVRHALAAGDSERAIELVERDALWLVQHSFMATLLGLVNRLPQDRLEHRYGLQLAIAWANCLTHHPSEAQKALDLVEHGLAKSDVHGEQSIRAEARVVQGCIDIYADRLEGVEALVRPAVEEAETYSPWVVGVGANVLTYVLIHTYRFEEAVRLQTWAGQFHARTQGPFANIYGRCFAGMAEFSLGRITQTEEKFSDALRLARDIAGRHSHAAHLAGALLGQLFYERNELSDAELLLEESRTLGVEGGVVDFSIATYIYDARLKALKGNYEDARAILDEGAHTAQALNTDRLAYAVESERVRLHLLQGDVEAAEQLLAYLEKVRPSVASESPGIAHQVHEIRQRARAQVHCAKGEYEQAKAILQALLADAQQRGRRNMEMQLRAQLAHTLELAGSRSDAEEVLAPAVVLGAAQGMVRTFLDEGPRLITVLERLRERCRRGQLPPETPPTFAYSLSSIIAAGRQSRNETSSGEVVQRPFQPRAAVPTEPLKERELEILKKLELGRANKEIARELGIGVDTVKWYLKALYSKLGVAGRTQAINEARRRRLLS